jgi:hypothetical protein
LTYDISTIDHAWQGIILDGFCEVSRLTGIRSSPRDAVRKESGVTAMLYGRYHGKILDLAIRSGADGGWKAKLREILAEFDDDCRDLSRSRKRVLRCELATQIEQELLRFADPNKRAVLSIALKHFDSL